MSNSETRYFNFKYLSLAFIVAVVLWYFQPWLDARGQTERAHGFKLPDSAKNAHTVGDWRTGFLDRGASSTLTMPTDQLDLFITELSEAYGLRKISDPAPTRTNAVGSNALPFGGGAPQNARYHIGLPKPWGKQDQAIKSYLFNSPVGDFLALTVFRLSDSEIAIHFYTDWN